MSGAGTSEAETRVPPSGAQSETTDAPETIDWAAAWTRGTLGSLGRFHLRERLGDGGFGQVYLAYDPRLDRDVALKVLKQPDPSDRVMERFFREARAVARLDHPNIVPVHDAGCEDGRCWVAYQLVGGRPLWWYRDRQRMDPVTAARIVRDLADALSHAHNMGVVHRDIKPGNVMIDDRGRPRLIDFGLARRSDVESDLTRDGVIVGTPAYMSPEQAIGLSSQADERSDVYSLGVIFYELLCGRRPHDLRTDSENAKPGPPRPRKELPPVRSINRHVPRALEAICIRAMSPKPSDRHPSARVLAEGIDEWLTSRRGPGLRAALGVLALTVFVGLAVAALSVPRLIPGDVAPDRPAVAVVQAVGSPTPIPGPSLAPPAREEKEETKHVVAKPPLLLAPGQIIVSNLASRAKKERVYHTTACAAARKITVANRRFLDTTKEAEEQEYSLCANCKASMDKKSSLPPPTD